MRNQVKIGLALLLLTITFWGCEKDDICAESTPTTPRIVIEFYDFANPTVLKSVTNLRIEEVGTTNAVVANTTASNDSPLRYLFNSNKISIPLKSFEDQSEFNFKLNYDDVSENSDEIIISYSRENIYLSRACGYVTNFTLNNTSGITVTPDADNWIQNIFIENTAITNENETHVKIYF